MEKLAWRVRRVTEFLHLVDRNGSIQFVSVHITTYLGWFVDRIVWYSVVHMIALFLNVRMSERD